MSAEIIDLDKKRAERLAMKAAQLEREARGTLGWEGALAIGLLIAAAAWFARRKSYVPEE